MTQPITCQEMLRRLYEYLDGELDPGRADEVRQHIDLCEACYPEVKFTTRFRDALHRAAHGQPGPPTELRDRVRRLLEAEEE